MKVDVARPLWEKRHVHVRGALTATLVFLLAPAAAWAQPAQPAAQPAQPAAQPAQTVAPGGEAAPAPAGEEGEATETNEEANAAPRPKPTAGYKRPGAPSWERPIMPGEGRPVPESRDDRSGHFYVRPEGGIIVPLGRLHTGLASGDVVATGLFGGGSIGVGLSRYAELFARGGYGVLGSASGCEECDARLGFVDLGFRYHLAQGVALDPTIGFAAGYRNMSITGLTERLGDLGPDDMGTYQGLDIATVSLGAMYSPVRGFGFGPEISATLGTFLSRPVTDTETGTSAYFMLHVALSIELDPVGWFTDPEPIPPSMKTTASSNDAPGAESGPPPF